MSRDSRLLREAMASSKLLVLDAKSSLSANLAPVAFTAAGISRADLNFLKKCLKN